MADRNKPRSGGYAASLSNLEITADYLNPDYEIVRHDLTRGETGLLRVFSLIPKARENPSFHARVDDGGSGSPRSPELDIDIQEVSDAERNAFRGNRNGYAGHHTDRSPSPQLRRFEVEIATPSGTVFKGSVSFNVNFSLAVSMGTYSVVMADARGTRATPAAKIDGWLKSLWTRLRTLFERLLK